MYELKIYFDKEKHEKALRALIAVIEAFDLQYKIEDDDELGKVEIKSIKD